jgi:phage terminase large subunit-like protein
MPDLGYAEGTRPLISVPSPGTLRTSTVPPRASIRSVLARYEVREIACTETDWAWIVLQLEGEDLPVVHTPLSPQRSARAWQLFYDAVIEHRLTHDADPLLARHVGNLSLIASPHGLRPDLTTSSEGAFVNAAVAAMIAYERAATQPEEQMAPPSFQWL